MEIGLCFLAGDVNVFDMLNVSLGVFKTVGGCGGEVADGKEQLVGLVWVGCFGLVNSLTPSKANFVRIVFTDLCSTLPPSSLLPPVVRGSVVLGILGLPLDFYRTQDLDG